MWVTEGGDLCTADWAALPAGAPARICRLHAAAVRSAALVSDEKRIRVVYTRRCTIQVDYLYLSLALRTNHTHYDVGMNVCFWTQCTWTRNAGHGVLCDDITDTGVYGTLCVHLRTDFAQPGRCQVPQVRRLGGTASDGTWHHTLGMSTVSDAANAASLLLSQARRSQHLRFSHIEATYSISVLSFNFFVVLSVNIRRCCSRWLVWYV